MGKNGLEQIIQEFLLGDIEKEYGYIPEHLLKLLAFAVREWVKGNVPKEISYNEIIRASKNDIIIGASHQYAEGWNACRDVMLKEIE